MDYYYCCCCCSSSIRGSYLVMVGYYVLRNRSDKACVAQGSSTCRYIQRVSRKSAETDFITALSILQVGNVIHEPWVWGCEYRAGGRYENRSFGPWKMGFILYSHLLEILFLTHIACMSAEYDQIQYEALRDKETPHDDESLWLHR